MKQKLIDFLKELEATIPPPPKCHHALMYAQYGSDADGWQDKLALQINVGGVFQCWFLDDGEIDGPAESLISAIVAGIKTPGEFQRGVASGQFIE